MGVVVLMSGGLDSTVLAEQAARSRQLAAVVFVDYGHPSRQSEAWRAFQWAEHRRVRMHVLHTMGLHTGDMDGRAAPGAQVVPGRNALLLSAAVNVASALGADEVWLGATVEDAVGYPDCRPEFVRSMDRVFRSAYGIGVRAPLSSMSRSEVNALAAEFGVSDTWSCYGPGPDRCGQCDSCRQGLPGPPLAG